MHGFPAMLACLAAIAAPLCLPATAKAALSGPAPSYVRPMRDGAHILVMLSDASPDEDEGRVCTLPDGTQVDVRETFPSSGLYKIGSTVPVYALDWYEGDYMVLSSPDGRNLVRVNWFGGGGYGQPVTLGWGVKFYESGREFKNYNVAELVEYPSLMEWTSFDYHYLWIEAREYDAEIDAGSFELRTTTHERYRFDIANGVILEEHRMWPKVARAGKIALLGIATLAAVLIMRVRKSRRNRLEEVLAIDDSPVVSEKPARRFSFSLRSLFLLTAAVGAFLAAPHLGVCLIALALSAHAMRRIVQPRRSISRGATRGSSMRGTAGLWIYAVSAWFCFYILSFGPVMGAARRFDWPQDVCNAIVQVVFAPAYWLLVNTPFGDWDGVDYYFDAWEDTWRRFPL